MVNRYARASVVALCATGAIAAPAITQRQNSGGIGVLDVFIPPTRSDDKYYDVNLVLDGQTLPILVDTGSGDLFVASENCPNNNASSACYNIKERFQITNSTRLIPNETFFTIVGEGTVYGNNSNLTVAFGDIVDNDLATGLVYNSATNEFQNGSFAGILGLNMRAVSRQLYFNKREPPFDDMLKKSELAEPKFSLTVPRLGDEGSTGKLTIGGIGEEFEGKEIKYGSVYSTPNYNLEGYPLDRQGWTIHLEGIRVNNKTVTMNNGSLLSTGEYLGMIDSGSWSISFRTNELDQIVSFLNGPTIYQTSGDVFFACDIPQLIELKYFDTWYPVNPLDLIVPNDHGAVNGTEMCHAGLGRWSRTFGDSIVGVPFLRSVGAVFDYIESDMTPQPRVGLVGMVNKEEAIATYSEKLAKRLRPRV